MLTRPLITVGISFLTVALVVSFFSFNETLAVLTILVVLFFLSLMLLTSQKRMAVCIITLSGIVACASYCLFTKNEYDLDRFDKISGTISAKVIEINPTNKSNTSAYKIKLLESDIPEMPNGFKAILYANADKEINVNDTILCTAKAFKISSLPNFDMKRFYRADSIYLNFTSFSDMEISLKGEQDLFYFAYKLNRACGEIIDNNINKPYSGLLKAILLGDDSDIDDIIYNDIVRAGISHIFVVSGLHISLLATIVFAFLKLFSLPLKWRSGIAILAAWGFVAITGFGIPAIRAGIMMTVLMAGNFFRRKSDSLNSLFLAGIIIILFSPAAVSGGSFLLSFSATLGVILLSKPIASFGIRKLNCTSKPLTFVIKTVAMTFASNLAMLPVIIYIFGGISLISPLANLIAVPLLSVVLIAGILLLCFSAVPILGHIISEVIEFLLYFITKSAEILTAPSFAYIGLNYSFVYIWLILTIILIMTAVIFIRKTKVTFKVTMLSFGALFLCMTFNSVYNHNNVEITNISGFDSKSVIITYDKKATVIGFESDGYIDKTCESFLRSKNIHIIENYIFAMDGTKDIYDTEFLAAAMPIYNMYISQEDELLLYANDIFLPKNGVYALKNNGGYDIVNTSAVKMSIEKYESGILLTLIAGETRVAITNSPELAASVNCEILYYNGKYSEKLKQNNAKYVILLSEFELKRLEDNFENVNISKEQITLSLRP